MSPKYNMNEWLAEFNNVLSEHLSDSKLTIGILADQMKISSRKLHRKIKKGTGMTPNHYIRNIRLEHAHELMSTGKILKVKEVVKQSGFVKIGYFYQIFKEKYGYPPGEVLRRNGWK